MAGTDQERVAACADLFAELRLRPRQIDALPAALRPRDEAEAYAIQLALHDRLRAAGLGERAGWKIGCTTRVMQEFLQIDQPCAGGMLQNGIWRSGAEISHATLCKPGIECEIAVRLAGDLPAGDAPYDRAGVAVQVGAVMAAIELVDERFTDFRSADVDAPSLIADDFFHVGAILGPELADWRDLDLAALGGRTLIDGVLRGSGRGGDVMGHPFEALAWLANHLAGLGLQLRRGDVVLTGSVVVTQYPGGPAATRAETDELGGVDLLFV